MLSKKMRVKLQEYDEYTQEAVLNADWEASLTKCAKALEWALKSMLQLENAGGG